jgi:hypothetical protein
MNKLTQEGIRLFQAGEKQKAARILALALQRDTHDEEAWYWLSACVDDLEKKRYCLRRVLQINPGNAKARRRLSRLDDLPEPEAILPAPYVPKHSVPYRKVGAVLLGVMILVGSIFLFSSLRMEKPGPGDLAAVLGELDEVPQSQLTISATDADLPPVVQIPVTGNPITISSSGSLETDPFTLPSQKMKLIWQYGGRPDEESRTSAAFEEHQSRMLQIEDDFEACMKEKQAELKLALIRQDEEMISLAKAPLKTASNRTKRRKEVRAPVITRISIPSQQKSS